MSPCLLADRTIIAVAGDEAEALLNRLVTRNLAGMSTGVAGSRYAALLSPQGKLQFDFLVYRRPDAFWIDVAAPLAADLARKLTLFKLRAKVTIESRDDLAVAAVWGDTPVETPGPTFRDPRHGDLGYRIVAEADRLSMFSADSAAYAVHRIGLGVPEGGMDFVYGDTFVHDANLDLLNGVDFDKGCYVGQEVVSRVHHRNSARKRIVRLEFLGDAPAVGAPLTAGAIALGHITSIAGKTGLATARVDRLEEAAAANVPVLAGETLVTVSLPTKSVMAAPDYAENDVD